MKTFYNFVMLPNKQLHNISDYKLLGKLWVGLERLPSGFFEIQAEVWHFKIQKKVKNIW